MRVIRSRDNPAVRRLVRLGSSPRERKRSSLTVLDGEHLIQAWTEAGGEPLQLLAASESAMERPALRRLVEATAAEDKLILTDSLLRQFSEVVSPSGVLAVVKTPERQPLPAFVEDGLFIEQVQDPGNLGSMLRTALAAGMTRVFLSPGSVLAWSPKAVRAGMGAHFRLSIHEDVDIEVLAGRCRGAMVATEPEAGISLYQTDLRRPILWLFGNEGAGLSERAAGFARERVKIPMPGGMESLNVAACVAVCLFEQARQRQGQ